TSPVGLGFRVPLIIASPWSRGGWVNSEVCDITSTIQFLETFLSKKTGKKIEEPNISSWRRTISGNLTSAFRPYNGEKIDLPKSLDRNEHIQEIYNARFKSLPNNYHTYSPEEARAPGLKLKTVLPPQEPGTKPSNALKYELYVEGRLSDDGKNFIIRFKSAKDVFGDAALGSPFNVYAPGNYLNKETKKFEPVKTWAFAVKSGTEIEYHWPLQSFEGEQYHLRVYGPNGFFREFRGKADTVIEVTCAPVKNGRKISGQLKINVRNPGKQALKLRLSDDKYQKKETAFNLKSAARESFTLDTASSHGWYDFSVLSSESADIGVRFAGRLETGSDSISDPFMGT
ncbi:MAG TPA: phospholipase domain-containing protein, partial [Chryseosolibacter sp.]